MVCPPVHRVIVVGVVFNPQFIIFIDHLVQSNRPIFGRLGGLLVKRGRCWDFQTHFLFVYVVTVHPLSVAIKRSAAVRSPVPGLLETVTVAVAIGKSLNI